MSAQHITALPCLSLPVQGSSLRGGPKPMMMQVRVHEGCVVAGVHLGTPVACRWCECACHLRSPALLLTHFSQLDCLSHAAHRGGQPLGGPGRQAGAPARLLLRRRLQRQPLSGSGAQLCARRRLLMARASWPAVGRGPQALPSKLPARRHNFGCIAVLLVFTCTYVVCPWRCCAPCRSFACSSSERHC